MLCRIAVAIDGNRGLEDTVSRFFGRASTFTIIDFEDDVAKIVKALPNPSAPHRHGTGRMVVMLLVDVGVSLVIARKPARGHPSILLNIR
ncbi:NifB/NifX family molybdenum-iron cluster-binding protein [Candidatus Hecatella orcuttiae]|jgi:predicted Fe-Mo cluster-binding NifX family protein|uniref:NifB/NifX family molybdenum-iron cluster-binding protein n=1 Tax=Candidatus Hecatella orcuttiae TaxID=1935119 RepID=UPI002867B754|nr:NifB/NifX family molybdenum-iron cluster-binding protein [Candidatus Hecatella orcuttiae]